MSRNSGFLLIEIADKMWKGHRFDDPTCDGHACLDISLSQTGFGTVLFGEPFPCGMIIQSYPGNAYFNVDKDGMMVAEAVVIWDSSIWPELRDRIRRCFSHDPFCSTTWEEFEQYLAGEISVLPSADWSRTLELRRSMALPDTCPAEPFVVLMIKQVARRRITPEQADILRKLIASVAQKLLPKK